MTTLLNTVAIITGGTKGMGKAQVRGLIHAGAAVVFSGRDREAGVTLAAELGDRALFEPMDVGEESDWQRLVAHTLDRFGRITALVNNAGMPVVGAITAMTVEQMDACYRTNQRGTLLGIKHVADPMRATGGGSIINIGSVAARKGHPDLTVYSGAKAAISGITRAAAIELAPSRIRVNALHPGYFATGMLDEASQGDGVEAGNTLTPLRRTAVPDEIVGTILYLVSDASSYVTGTEFSVDGGYTA